MRQLVTELYRERLAGVLPCYDRIISLPDGKLILPGVVSYATNVVEHSELVADRILRFASLVGRERIIASIDCGLDGRVHPDIAWAKLEALAHGTALATRQLWRRAPAMAA